jgi:hypothetical protein
MEPIEVVRDLVLSDVPEVELDLTEQGSTFLGKFATASALNSNRNFVSDFHGEIRITLFENKKVECSWWAEGRVTDPTVYEGVNGFIESFSTLCTGKLQRDGSFEFQGVYKADGPEHASGDAAGEEPGETFTLSGSASKEIIQGTLLIGGVLRNSPTLQDPSTLQKLEEGIVFEAVLLE